MICNEFESQLLLRKATVHADRNKLSQVIRNLISNALKFTPEGGLVTVSVSVSDIEKLAPLAQYSRSQKGKGPVLRIEVKDTGPGIAQVSWDDAGYYVCFAYVPITIICIIFYAFLFVY